MGNCLRFSWLVARDTPKRVTKAKRIAAWVFILVSNQAVVILMFPCVTPRLPNVHGTAIVFIAKRAVRINTKTLAIHIAAQ
jgi:hypothetical protein